MQSKKISGRKTGYSHKDRIDPVELKEQHTKYYFWITELNLIFDFFQSKLKNFMMPAEPAIKYFDDLWNKIFEIFISGT